MKKREIQEKMGTPDKYFEEVDINPLKIAIAEEWDKIETMPAVSDYRERALDKVIKSRLKFKSEFNTITNLVKRVIKVINPFNGNEMVESFSGGNSEAYTISFKDEKTEDLVQFTFHLNGITIIPKNHE